MVRAITLAWVSEEGFARYVYVWDFTRLNHVWKSLLDVFFQPDPQLAPKVSDTFGGGYQPAYEQRSSVSAQQRG